MPEQGGPQEEWELRVVGEEVRGCAEQFRNGTDGTEGVRSQTGPLPYEGVEKAKG